MGQLLEQIGNYWDKRAKSYSEGLFSDFEIRVWKELFAEMLPRQGCRVLDIGTGPGFFACILAEEGYDVTAVDYTEGMLSEARKNAGELANRIKFMRMDAQELAFPDDSFDVIVNRNVTWNLEDPQKAYKEWNRVLAPGGRLLVFDASWYEYLYDEKMAASYTNDRKRTTEAGLVDGSVSYEESPVMEKISMDLYFSKRHRPDADFGLLDAAGFKSVSADTDLWKRVWSEEEKIMYASTPMFMIQAHKEIGENEKNNSFTAMRRDDRFNVRLHKYVSEQGNTAFA